MIVVLYFLLILQGEPPRWVELEEFSTKYTAMEDCLYIKDLMEINDTTLWMKCEEYRDA